jgi:hypothetical protein
MSVAGGFDMVTKMKEEKNQSTGAANKNEYNERTWFERRQQGKGKRKEQIIIKHLVVNRQYIEL